MPKCLVLVWFIIPLINFLIKENKNSEIVREQLNKDYNVLTLEKFEDGEEGAKIVMLF